MSDLVTVTTDAHDRLIYVGPNWRVLTYGHDDNRDDGYIMWGGSSTMSVSSEYRALIAPDIAEKEAAAMALVADYGTYGQRGQYPQLDEAFDILNNRISEVSEDAVRSIIPLLAEADPRITERDVATVLENVRFRERGGCACPCSPAAVLGLRLCIDGQQLDFSLTAQIS